MNTQKFIRKPLIVDAVQVTTDNFAEVADWCRGDIHWSDGTALFKDGSYKGTIDPLSGAEPVPVSSIKPESQYIRVRVVNPKSARQSKAFVTDWILYTERGYKVYTNKAFRASFDPVSSDQLTTDELREEVAS